MAARVLKFFDVYGRDSENDERKLRSRNGERRELTCASQIKTSSLSVLFWSELRGRQDERRVFYCAKRVLWRQIKRDINKSSSLTCTNGLKVMMSSDHLFIRFCFCTALWAQVSFRYCYVKSLFRKILCTDAVQRDVRLARLKTQETAFLCWEDSLRQLDMSRLKYVSFEKKTDGRKGFKVIYNGKQLLSLASKHEAEAFITKHLRSIGNIGTHDPPPVKARYRPKATKKSKICGIILRPQSGMYVGCNHDIGESYDSRECESGIGSKKIKTVL